MWSDARRVHASGFVDDLIPHRDPQAGLSPRARPPHRRIPCGQTVGEVVSNAPPVRGVQRAALKHTVGRQPHRVLWPKTKNNGFAASSQRLPQVQACSSLWLAGYRHGPPCQLPAERQKLGMAFRIKRRHTVCAAPRHPVIHEGTSRGYRGCVPGSGGE